MEDRPPDAPDPFPPSAAWTPPPPPPPPPTEPPSPAAVLPWEQPGVPWLSGLVETVKLLIARPREAFERMPLTGDVLRPFVFAILLGWIGAIFGAIWNVAFRGIMPTSGEYAKYGVSAAMQGIFALFAPVLIVCVLLVAAAIYHVMLLIVGGAKNGFGATLRVVCYSQAPQIFVILPFCGALIAAVGSLFLTIQGFATAHRISVGKSALAVLLPAVLCCICVFVLAITVGAAIMARFANVGMGH